MFSYFGLRKSFGFLFDMFFFLASGARFFVSFCCAGQFLVIAPPQKYNSSHLIKTTQREVSLTYILLGSFGFLLVFGSTSLDPDSLYPVREKHQ